MPDHILTHARHPIEAAPLWPRTEAEARARIERQVQAALPEPEEAGWSARAMWFLGGFIGGFCAVTFLGIAAATWWVL